MTGLLGLDCEHTCRTEIHPVYGMAMEVFDPSDKTGSGGDVYAIFARNYGDEGYCSSLEHEIDVPKLSVRIPWRAGATGVTILNKPDNSDGYFRANEASIDGPNVSWVAGQGILVQFDVPPGLTHAMVNGELHVVWTEASGAGSKARRQIAKRRRRPARSSRMTAAKTRSRDSTTASTRALVGKREPGNARRSTKPTLFRSRATRRFGSRGSRRSVGSPNLRETSP